MASAGDIHSILYKGDILKQKKPSYDASKKVKRYFPGKVPEYASEWSTAEEEWGINKEKTLVSQEKEETEDKTLPNTNATCTLSIHERRLQLLGSITNSESSVESQSKRRRQVIEQGTILKRGENQHPALAMTSITLTIGDLQETKIMDEEEGEKARESKRDAAVKSRIQEEEVLNTLEKQKLEEFANDLSDDGEESSGSDFSEESENIARPLFIPPAQRSCLNEANKKERVFNTNTSHEEELQERRDESKKLLISAIAEEEAQERMQFEAQQKASWDPENLPDDDDTVNEEEEYELWKIREMQRIIRNRDEQLKRQAFLEEIERRRNMEEEERRKDDERLDASRPKAPPSSKYKFMQKYYHKGAFFQDLTYSGEEPIYLRDFNVPVGEDRIDKSTLPKPMRLRRDQFGKAGQVKHTHLADVDTTDFSFAWSKPLNSKIRSKMAGLKGERQLERPSTKKK